jgi:hypothetical protein
MSDSETGARREFLREDMSVECSTDEHDQIKQIAYVFFAIWPLGVPLLYLLMLLPCRDALISSRSTPLTRATSFLHDEYVAQYFWWEALFVLQRLTVTGFAMFFLTAKQAIWRILFGIYATVGYMSLLLIFRPYVHRDLNVRRARPLDLRVALSLSLSACCWLGRR